MAFKDLLNKLKQPRQYSGRGREVDDRYLDSLEREWKTIQNDYRKKELKSMIKEEYEKRNRENVWGIQKKENVFDEIDNSKSMTYTGNIIPKKISSADEETRIDKAMAEREVQEYKEKRNKPEAKILKVTKRNIRLEEERQAKEKIKQREQFIKDFKKRQKQKASFDKQAKKIQTGIANGLNNLVSAPRTAPKQMVIQRSQIPNNLSILNAPNYFVKNNQVRQENNVLQQPYSILSMNSELSNNKRKNYQMKFL